MIEKDLPETAEKATPVDPVKEIPAPK